MVCPLTSCSLIQEKHHRDKSMFCSLGFMVIDTVGTPLEGKVLVYPLA
jgi:hypothetical protein